MSRHLKRLSLALASFIPASGGIAVAATLSIEAAPLAALDTALNAVPGIHFTAVTTDREKGRLTYEFSGLADNGRRIEVDVFANGDLDEIEFEEREEDLPAPVRNAVLAKEPGAVITFVEASVHRTGGFFYEIELRLRDGRRLAMEVTESGKITRVVEGALG